MIYQPTTINDTQVGLPKPPAWVTPGHTETRETAAFRSGAALIVPDVQDTEIEVALLF
jgi:hypothetical protein